jgi:deoxycytidylate deaminase
MNKKVIAVGFNKYADMRQLSSIHAELDAIQKIKKKDILRNCDMYVVRIDNMACITHNQTRLSYPCPYCKQEIIDKQIKRIFYSGYTTDEDVALKHTSYREKIESGKIYTRKS